MRGTHGDVGRCWKSSAKTFLSPAQSMAAEKANAEPAQYCSTAPPALACITSVRAASGKRITTIEGLAGAGALHPVQQAFVREGAMQYGSCTPGMILRTVALRERAPSPTRAQILEALDGSLYRCNGYPRIVAAFEPAARLRRSSAQKQEGVRAAE